MPCSSSLHLARVGQLFGMHAHTYEKVTPVQDQMGSELLRLLERHSEPGDGGKCVDLGCGTGRLTAQFQDSHPESKVLGIDLSERMVQKARRLHPSIKFRVGDAQHCDFSEDEKLAVVLSNAMLQWTDEPVRVIRDWSRRLAPQGIFAFATFVQGTFRELEASFRAAYESHGMKVKSHVLPLVDSRVFGDGLPLLEAKRGSLVLRYSSVGAFLKALRGAGAASTGGDVSPVPRRVFRSMKDFYTQNFTDKDGQLEVSYEVFYGLVRSAP